MSEFTRRLRAANPPAEGRRWLFVPYDQLTDEIGPLREEPAGSLGIVLVESVEKAERRPYHKQKLALILANLRHFAVEQAKRGVAVRHVVTDGSYAGALEPLISELGPLRVMEPAERELWQDLAKLVRTGGLQVIPHGGWLTTEEDFQEAMAGRREWRMDVFYRHVRKRTGLLMEGGRPAGGQYSFDPENREPWPGEPPAPEPPRFRPDEITREVGELVAKRFSDHPGTLNLARLPATKRNARRIWKWARESCLPNFGPYEDAMSVASSTLFHTRISGLLNLHRLTPRRVVDDALGLDIPLPSKEGFVRQILGWRELMRHIHRDTDGFRALEGEPNHLSAELPLPAAYWGAPSGLACLDRVVRDVWQEAYSHHITRLMVLSNIATLLGVSPRALTDWFWVAYQDAYDWVVEPNVLGMGTFALGDLFTTKPYVSGAAYIDRMSDYCPTCAFNPKKDCPITNLYWAFLARNEECLQDNPRLRMPYASLRKRAKKKREEDRAVARWVEERLSSGEVVRPDQRPSTTPT